MVCNINSNSLKNINIFMYIMVLSKDGSRAKSQRGAQFSGGAYMASPGSGNLAIVATGCIALMYY